MGLTPLRGRLRDATGPRSARRAWIPLRSSLRVATVVVQSMQASVTDCPYVRVEGPVAGIDCLPIIAPKRQIQGSRVRGRGHGPAMRLDSIMTPIMLAAVSFSPSCLAMSVATRHCRSCFFSEFPCELRS
jgi:hypothetical protein